MSINVCMCLYVWFAVGSAMLWAVKSYRGLHKLSKSVESCVSSSIPNFHLVLWSCHSMMELPLSPETANMWHWDTWLLTVSFFSLIPWGPLKLWTNQTFHYPSCLLEALFHSGTELIQKDLARDMGSWLLKLVYTSKLKKVLCGLEKLHYWYRHSLMTYFWAMRISIFLCK